MVNCAATFTSNLYFPGDLNEKYIANLHHTKTFKFNEFLETERT